MEEGRNKVIRPRKEALSNALLRGRLTVEASLALPIFIFLMAMILFLFVMMRTQYLVGNCLDRAVSDVSLMKGISGDEAAGLTKAAFYRELSAQGVPLSYVELGAAGFSWKGMKADASYIDAKVSYRVRFPISFFGVKSMAFSNGRRMHRWTGENGAGSKDGDVEWVYVTPTGTVYHSSRDCTYLKLSITPVSSARLGRDLGKYLPCALCVKGGKPGATVYVTDEGDCYHNRINCSGLKRTVYMIRKDQAGTRRPCTRCGG